MTLLNRNLAGFETLKLSTVGNNCKGQVDVKCCDYCKDQTKVIVME